MAERQDAVETIYEQAKNNQWQQVLAAFIYDFLLAQKCSHYQKPSSGWTFLHQAAFFGHETACRQLIRFGAHIDIQDNAKKSPCDIAKEHHHEHLAKLLEHAKFKKDSLWSPPSSSDLLASSNLWNEASERKAMQQMNVAYGGGTIAIPVGSRYFVDSFERILVGWHGTYDPPCDMDANPQV